MTQSHAEKEYSPINVLKNNKGEIDISGKSTKEIEKKKADKIKYAAKNWPSKLAEYEEKESILGGRNSYSKTDTDGWTEELDSVKYLLDTVDNVIDNPFGYTKLKEKIMKARKDGLAKEGEFSIENLVFKRLRNTGWLERLIDAGSNSYSAIYSDQQTKMGSTDF